MGIVAGVALFEKFEPPRGLLNVAFIVAFGVSKHGSRLESKSKRSKKSYAVKRLDCSLKLKSLLANALALVLGLGVTNCELIIL